MDDQTTTDSEPLARDASQGDAIALQSDAAAVPKGLGLDAPASAAELAPWQQLLLEHWNAHGGNAGPPTPQQLGIDAAKFANLHKLALRAPLGDQGEKVTQALWHSTTLPSGHSGERADVLIKLVIRELARKGQPPRLTVSDIEGRTTDPNSSIARQEAGQLMELGRGIVVKADRKFRDGGMSWEKFILQRLRWDLPKKLKQLRRGAVRTVSMNHYVITPPGEFPEPREITLDLEDRSKYSEETLEKMRLGGWRGKHGKAPRSSVEDQLMIAEGTADNQKTLIDKIFRGISPEERNIIVLVFGMNGNAEHSLVDLAKRFGGSRTAAHRKVQRAVAHARENILLSEKQLAELTCTTDPARQMAVLRWLEVFYEPPKQWLLHSSAPDGRLQTSTVRERGTKPAVVWLNDVRYLLLPERLEQLGKKLTQELWTLMSIYIPSWQQEEHGLAVDIVAQALQCLARIREGKFKL